MTAQLVAEALIMASGGEASPTACCITRIRDRNTPASSSSA